MLSLIISNVKSAALRIAVPLLQLLLHSRAQNGIEKIANMTARPTETITKSISHAMNLSVHLANLISIGYTSEDDGDDGSAIVPNISSHCIY